MGGAWREESGWSLGTTCTNSLCYICIYIVGGEPFSEFRLGATFDSFINFLKEGNRLEKPKGLSSCM